MPCLIGCLALTMPRVAIVLVVIFSDYIGRAYPTFIWPLLGFLFLPLTTLTWAWAINERGSLGGIHLVVVILAALFDLGLLGTGASSRKPPASRRGRRS